MTTTGYQYYLVDDDDDNAVVVVVVHLSDVVVVGYHYEHNYCCHECRRRWCYMYCCDEDCGCGGSDNYSGDSRLLTATALSRLHGGDDDSQLFQLLMLSS